MILANVGFNVVYTILFCIFFALSFLVLQSSRLEECFKKGKVWEIRLAYFIISFISGFLVAYGFNYLVGLFVF